MCAITDFTNKWFSTSNRVHKMLHKTTISLHSLQLHWITILLPAEIAAFIFNVATRLIFVLGTTRCLEEMEDAADAVALVHAWHFQRDGDAPRKNHQDAWLSPHSAAEPFCLAESPPAAHWARKISGDESYMRWNALIYPTLPVSCQGVCVNEGEGDWFSEV